MDFDALLVYPNLGQMETPDRTFGLRADAGEVVVEAVAVVLVVVAAGSVGAFLVLCWLLTTRPIEGLFGLCLPDLIGLVVEAGGATWIVVLTLVRRSNVDAAADYVDG